MCFIVPIYKKGMNMSRKYEYGVYSVDRVKCVCHLYALNAATDGGDLHIKSNMDYWQAIKLVAMLNEMQINPEYVCELVKELEQ